MKIKYWFLWIIVSLVSTIFSCEAPEPSREQLTEQTALAYFAVYQQREDWDSLLTFYREDLQFKDANLGYETRGIEAFKDFYNWPDTSFRKVIPEQKHLVLQELLVRDSVAVGRGRLSPFFWNNELQEWPEDFTIWLYFDQDMKIYRQTDWVRYPAWMLQSFER